MDNENKKDGVVYILRGISGSGKSTYAQKLIEEKQGVGVVICSADDHFMHDGEYKFDPSKLSVAHKLCRDKFAKAMHDGIQTIVIDNTNTTRDEYLFYARHAQSNGYRVRVVTFDADPELGISRNVHGVPDYVIRAQHKRLVGDHTPTEFHETHIKAVGNYMIEYQDVELKDEH